MLAFISTHAWTVIPLVLLAAVILGSVWATVTVLLEAFER